MKEFTYRIVAETSLLHSLHERTFGDRLQDLKFDRLELNPALDARAFELPPGLPKARASSLKEYGDFRTAALTDMLRTSTFGEPVQRVDYRLKPPPAVS